MKKEKIKILIAERETLTAQKLFATLAEMGYSSKILTTGENPIAAIRSAIHEQIYKIIFLEESISSSQDEYHDFQADLKKLLPTTQIVWIRNDTNQRQTPESNWTDDCQFLLKPIRDKNDIINLAETCIQKIQSNTYLQLIKRISEYITTKQKLNDVLQKLVDEVVKNLEYETCAIILKREDNPPSLYIASVQGMALEHQKEFNLEIGTGVTGKVVELGRPRIVPNIYDDPSFNNAEIAGEGSLYSMASIPVCYNQRVLGALNVYTGAGYVHSFRREEIDLFSILANWAAFAIYTVAKDEVKEKEQKRLIEENILINHFYRIGHSIASSQGIKKNLKRIAQSALEVLHAEPVILLQYDQATNRLIPPPIYAGNLIEERGYVETFEFSGHSFAELIVRHGESLYIEQDIDRNPLMIEARKHAIGGMPEKRFHEREKSQSLAALILRADDEVVGVMFLNYRRPQKFSPIEKQLMEAFCSQAAIAVKNSRLMEQLRNNELKSIFDGIPDPIIVTENKFEGSTPIWLIGYANREVHEMFGYDFGNKELVGKNARDLFGKQLSRLREALRDDNGKISNFETSFLHKAGYPIPISLSTSILEKEDAGKILKTIGIAKDLTSQKELEKSKITIDKLRLTLADVGHEFRSPLHIIISQLGGLKYHLDKKYGEDQQVKKVAKIIEEEAFRAARQMKNTLLSTVESFEALGANFEKGSIGDTIVLCANRFFETADKRGIKIIVWDSVKKLPPIYYDKTQMEQVFTNLVDNAVKYSHFNQDIEIRGKEIGKNVEIAIMDYGLGIPKNQYERIFQAFSRSEVLDTKRFIPGTGLGLTIAREIVERHKGKITIESTPLTKDLVKIQNYEGYVTTFHVLLPHNPKEV